MLLSEFSSILISGASLIICEVVQVKLLVGFHIPRHERIFKTLSYLFTHINETRLTELLMGLAWLAVLLLLKAAARRHP